MSKWLKIIFVSSVVLNIALIIGVIWARSYIGKQFAESAVAITEAEGSFTRHILTEIESCEPDRIETLKNELQNSIENTEKTVDMWRQVAEK